MNNQHQVESSSVSQHESESPRYAKKALSQSTMSIESSHNDQKQELKLPQSNSKFEFINESSEQWPTWTNAKNLKQQQQNQQEIKIKYKERKGKSYGYIKFQQKYEKQVKYENTDEIPTGGYITRSMQQIYHKFFVSQAQNNVYFYSCYGRNQEYIQINQKPSDQQLLQDKHFEFSRESVKVVPLKSAQPFLKHIAKQTQ